MQRCLAFTLFVLASAAAAAAQTIGQNAQPGSEAVTTLRVRTQLVTEAVTVTDKAGRPVPGLMAKDFTLTEDGVPQHIRFCEHQSLAATSAPLPALAPDQADIKIYKTLGREQVAPEQTSEQSTDLRYRDRRLMALYFDTASLGRADQLRALAAAEQFVRTQMSAADLVAILRYSTGSVDVLQDFTADRARLLSILETMQVGENQQGATEASDASNADTGAAFGQDDSEFNVFNTDRQLSALQTASNLLGHLNEKKVLVYFASGLQLNGVDNQAQLHATVDAAIRAGVSFWPVDARGLVADAPLGDATRGSPGGVAVYNGTAEQAAQADFQQSQDTLYALAGDTGGKALLDTNDLARGIVQAQHAISDYYIIGYYTTNAALDGRFRRVKIATNAPEAAKLDYREGYYAAKEFSRFNAADKERQLEDALLLEDPITDLTVAMELNYFQLNRAEYFVPYVLKIPGSELSLAKRRGADYALIDFIGEVKDVYGGTTVTNVRDNVRVPLGGRTEAELARVPIEYDAGFTLLPGKYRIKLLARDDVTGRIGTYETTFTIPNLNKEQVRIPVSSVVLSSQRVDLKDAAYNAEKGRSRAKEEATNPMIFGETKLIPSVTRVFHRDRNLYIYLQGYEAGDVIVKPLISYAALFRDGANQFTSEPVAVTPVVSDRLKPVAFSFSVSLNHLQPGAYQCQISVLDPTEGKSSFWRAAIEIIP